ncbi:DUF4974 domain-containing protein [Niastella caeni]|uniref:DUF4974 domain-containing protein n=1 Tax=Niastella caeni TaxID=2569763 RepID=A0A4S8HLF6_9BACT|nr:FecR family protein [Niastella caeni]THU35995.1 DUF4974 domain-containing protein [Niastella caeni]
MNASSTDPQYIAALILKQLQGNIANEEKDILDAWIAANADHQRLWNEMNDVTVCQAAMQAMARYDAASALERFMQKHANPEPQAKRRVMALWKWMAAAAVMVLAFTAYWWFVKAPYQQPVVAENQAHVDVAPGKNGAILTLANGERVVLDSLQNGVVALQNGTKATLKDGELVYAPPANAGSEMVYNTISVPNGRQFMLTLHDGTRVWLNAASSIRYPVAFTGTQRQVEVSGETYFEVVKNKKMPFRVTVDNRAEIEVLGTHFNVNAYDNEETLNTTLLEGAVRITTRQAASYGKQLEQVLVPGQQLQLSDKGAAIVEPELEKVIAWKNGLFNFEGVYLKTAMKQIARWYDVEVVYRGNVPDIKFFGSISRSISLAGLIKGFQSTGVHMTIENGKQLIVMP